MKIVLGIEKMRDPGAGAQHQTQQSDLFRKTHRGVDASAPSREIALDAPGGERKFPLGYQLPVNVLRQPAVSGGPRVMRRAMVDED
jgi:hypothetical protein